MHAPHAPSSHVPHVDGSASPHRRHGAAASTPGRQTALVASRLLLVAAALAATLLLPLAAAGQGVGPEVGSTLPAELQLEDLDGNAVTLGDYMEAGVPTLIEIWASWCENCEALQPEIDALRSEYGEGVNVVAVAVAVSQSQRRVRRHVEEHGHGYPYLWDGRGAAVRALNAATTSIVILADGEGRIVYTGVGGQQDLRGAMAKLRPAARPR